MKLNCKMRSIGLCAWTWCTLYFTMAAGYEDTSLPEDKEILGHTLRHLRHSRADFSRQTEKQNPQNEWAQLQSTTNTLTIQDNHKPFFEDCLSYKPSVKESEPSGTEVIQVRAKDIDLPSNGGTIKYRIMKAPAEREKFTIEPDTGIIRTKYPLDRDDPEREKEIYITVIAEDNGTPQLSDACTMKITVEDINDNEPMFDRVIYEELVPKDLPQGREVMRISATDIDDGRNSIVQYALRANSGRDDLKYFRIDPNTGIIYLMQDIDKEPNYNFNLTATATDQGEVPMSNTVNIKIRVVESNKKAPQFTELDPSSSIQIPENEPPLSRVIVTLRAESNTDEVAPLFQLEKGRTEQTNGMNTWILESEGREARIKLARQLDFETVSNYTITVRIVNKFQLAKETNIFIHLIDVNDNIPVFVSDDGSSLSHSVLENEDPGTIVMQVKAVDADSSDAHNQITYELADNTDNFSIDKVTGVITTLKKFDREEKDVYHVKVIATDSSESANQPPGSHKHNQGQQVFRIDIADKNDHPPVFNQKTYEAENIPEDANNHRLVAQVKANDTDDASTLTYSILDGNIDDAFEIDAITGQISVKNKLDYEKITNYTLRVKVSDGSFSDYCTVLIKVLNVNDNRPVFEERDREITIQEETIPDGCIAVFKAYDPDIANRSQPQHIKYFIPDEKKLGLSIDQDGCLRLTRPMDRDEIPKQQVRIGAQDEDGASTSQKEYFELVINLTDINDNAPYLDMKGSVVWRENQGTGIITTLVAKDKDSEINGAPFKYEMAPEASDEIRTKFGINGDQLEARTTFDREEKKVYHIPIAITDSGSPPMTGTSILVVIIGDQNDNPMKEGKSSIFVYNYKGESPDTEIGRVYVTDPDDWDLPDKVFRWKEGPHTYFDLNSANGMITMRSGAKEGSYMLYFKVTEEALSFKKHSVEASVNVTVKVIPEEAVDKSGSIRLNGITAEEFIEPNRKGISKATILKNRLSKMLNTSVDNVDVFTVLHSPYNLNENQLDVRFSAHGSPYYAKERINMAVSMHQGIIEKELGAEILMVHIDECMQEKTVCNLSCITFLNKNHVPLAVYTNTTSFVGVSAIATPFCSCDANRRVCHNGGTLVGDTCVCPDKFEGPNCEKVSIGFSGNGYALYSTLESCADSTLSFDLRAYKADGLVFYVGPTSHRSSMGVKDFMSLELRDGYPVLFVDYGTGTTRLDMHEIKLDNGNSHHIDIILSNTSIELQVDRCKLSPCLALKTPIGSNVLLNVNGPLQLGGTFLDMDKLAPLMNWTMRPTMEGFVGCISNMTFNRKLYNLGFPSMKLHAEDNCDNSLAGALTLGFNSSFLIAILICCAILLMLLLAVIVQRKKTNDSYKDVDDIRENIIDYEEEGGGEGDMTGFNLDVLRCTNMYDADTKIPNGHYIKGSGDEVPDICGFLDSKKQHVDNDPETNPFDDVRHYAYEGEGNTTGSLSSLASVTDEGDLNFDYLSNFGPRFRKLADMYGEDPSDEEDENYQPQASESWC